MRSYAERVYGVAPAEVIGSSLETGYEYDAEGQAELIKEPKLELDNNNSGKAEDIYLFTGQRPQAAFGNSTGDREMLEWTTAGDRQAAGHAGPARRRGARVRLRPGRGPARQQGRHLHPGAATTRPSKRGWVVISMKNDWKRIFAFQP